MTDTIRTSIMELLRLNERQVAMIDRLRTTEGRKSLAADRQRHASTLRALRDRGFSYYDPNNGSPYLTPRGDEVVKLLNLVAPTPPATAPSPAPVTPPPLPEGLDVRRWLMDFSKALGHPLVPPAEAVSPITVPELDARIDEHPVSNLLDLDRVLVGRIVRRAQYDALREVLGALDGWVEGARDNHEGLEHRDENAGEECWQTFHVEEIRNMVAYAARVLGVREVLDRADEAH